MPPASDLESTPVAQLEAISKHFGSTRALDRVSFDLQRGEVHVLAGENGAGKSTLVRILSGVYADYTGTVRIEGRTVRLRRPTDARQAGIATIHQELSLVSSLSIADNLWLSESASALSLRRRDRLQAAARRVLQWVDLQVDPNRPVDTLPLAQRQLIEIARALAQRAKVLILDEPTSALSEPDAERLFARLSRLRASGVAIVYISHRMEEIYRVADRITVLRDGRVVTTETASRLGQPQLVAAMVGRELAVEPPSVARPGGDRVLVVRSLTLRSRVVRRPILDDVACSVSQGEIVGLGGLQGSGISELLHALYGALGPIPDAQVELSGRPHRIQSPSHSIARGVVLLGNDRHLTVLGDLSVQQNATLTSLARFCRAGFVVEAAERQAVQAAVSRLRLRAASLQQPARELSGGNQQKVALARCLLARPAVLLLDEPTRGIDVGAKADVYALVRSLAATGVGVLLVASELGELTALCHRILVLAEGRVVGEFSRCGFSRRELLRLAMAQGSEAA